MVMQTSRLPSPKLAQCYKEDSGSQKRALHKLSFARETRTLSSLKNGDMVRLQKDGQWKVKAKVLDEVAPRSYRVKTDDGLVYRRNRQQMLRTAENQESGSASVSEDAVNQSERGPTELRRSSRVITRPKWMTVLLKAMWIIEGLFL